MMKLSKKVLAAFSMVAALAMAGTFVACSDDEDEDDPKGAIVRDNSDNFSIAFENITDSDEQDKKDTNLSGVYRAWCRTRLKHLGALTKITLKTGKDNSGTESKAGYNSGVMGFAWDLEDTDSDSKSETFNLVGVRNYGENGVEAYLSRYYNVTNKQANNFGAETSEKKGTDAKIATTDVNEKTVEWDISDGFKTVICNETVGEKDEVEIWIDVAIVPEQTEVTNNETDATKKLKKEKELSNKYGTYSTRQITGYSNAKPGAWVVAIYDEDPSIPSDAAELPTPITPKQSWIIPAAESSSSLGSGYNAAGDTENGIKKFDTSSTQRKQAAYANVYKNAKLVGTWQYGATYFLDEIVEE